MKIIATLSQYHPVCVAFDDRQVQMQSCNEIKVDCRISYIYFFLLASIEMCSEYILMAESIRAKCVLPCCFDTANTHRNESSTIQTM